MTKKPSAAIILIASMLLAACGGGDTPSPNTTTWTVTAGGSSYQTADGGVTLEVPPAAVTRDTLITPQPLTAQDEPQNHAPVGGTLVQFNSVTFNTPVTLRFRIPASVADADVPFVRIFRKPDGAGPWQALATTVDAAARVASAQVSGFSGFGLFTATLGANEWEIGAPGGEFNGAANRLGLTVSAGAVRALYRVRYTPIAASDMGQSPAGWQYVENSAYDFVWSDVTTQFDPAATFRIRFDGLTLPCDPALVAIFTRTDFGDAHTWNQDATGADAAAATVLVNKLRQHALFCPEPVLPVHTVTREYRGLDKATITVNRVDQGVFVPVISQSYDFRQPNTVDLYDSSIIDSGVQVSAETLRVATLSDDSSGTTSNTALVDLYLDTNQIETIDSLPKINGPTFEWTPPGISRDGTTIAARVRYADSSGNTTRKTVRVYSRQTHALLSETDIPTTDRSDIEAVGNNGAVLLSDRRVNNITPTVTVVRNGSAVLQFPGTIPRLDPVASKVYLVNNGQVEEHDLTNSQTRSIPINPVDFNIIKQTSTILEIRYYRPVNGGCELVSRKLSTNQETVLDPASICPSQTGTSGTVTYMMR